MSDPTGMGHGRPGGANRAYTYKFLVDGRVCAGSAASEQVDDNFGGSTLCFGSVKQAREPHGGAASRDRTAVGNVLADGRVGCAHLCRSRPMSGRW